MPPSIPLLILACLAFTAPAFAAPDGFEDTAVYFKVKRPGAGAPAGGAEEAANGAKGAAKGGDWSKKLADSFNRAAEEMKGKVVWGNSGSTYEGNPDFWNTIKDGALEMKAGKKPSEAIADMFTTYNPPRYKVECVTGMQILLYKAIMDTISPANFDKLFKDGELVMSTGFSLVNKPPDGYCPPSILPYLAAGGDATKRADPAFLASLKPGTLVYFKNPGAAPPWHGENAVFLGADASGERQFFAHPFGKIAESALVTRLNEKKRDQQAESAYLHQGTISVTSKLAELMP